MKRRLAFLSVFVAIVLLPSVSFGQRGRWSSTPPMTPFGPAYDPTTMRQAGYNPLVYDQLMQEKMIIAQQKALIKQQQMMQKMQKNSKNQKKADAAPFTTDTGLQGQALVSPRIQHKTHKAKKDTSTTPETKTDATQTNTEATTATSTPDANAAAKPESSQSAAAKPATNASPPAQAATTSKP